MKIALMYVDAGKGHYVPAKALADSFERMGHEVVIEDLFLTMGFPSMKVFVKEEWRFLLSHTQWESGFHGFADTKLNRWVLRKVVSRRHIRGKFISWIKDTKPDLIISTNFFGGLFIPEMLSKSGIRIPTFQYCADVFDTPVMGVQNKLDMMYLPSRFGCYNAMRRGMKKCKVSLCPFPLQTSIFLWENKLSKEEMREKLGLEKGKFTVLYSLGGEGIGGDEFLYEAASRGLDLQVVAIGGTSQMMDKRLDDFEAKHPSFRLYRKGFVNNVNEYLVASDVQVGKAGANAFMESVYFRVPCMVTRVLYAFKACIDFFESYEIGWAENDVKKQVDILEDCYKNPEKLEGMRKKYSELAFEFDTDKFAMQILTDYNAALGKTE